MFLLMAVFVVYTAITLLVLQAQINEQERLSETLAAELAGESVLNAAYKAKAEDELDEVALIRDILGYTFPGEVIMVDISKIR
jgi:type II secretory pathway pseudopilin PulG